MVTICLERLIIVNSDRFLLKICMNSVGYIPEKLIFHPRVFTRVDSKNSLIKYYQSYKESDDA